MKFLLLLMVSSWSHLCTSAHVCDTGMALVGHILNIDGSRLAEASTSFVHAYNSTTLQQCLDDCCTGRYGHCSIAAHQNHSIKVNCMHFYCEPLNKCKFFASSLVNSFAFPAAGIQHRKESNTSIHSQDSTHSRSVIPRKGVLNNAVSRKGVGQNEVHEFTTLKNDYTTTSPRKGVEGLPLTTTETSTSVIKPRKGVEQDDYDFGITGAKIKPRKGVGPFIVPTLAFKTFFTSSVSCDLNSISSSISLEGQDSSKDSDFLSLLQNVFRDEIERHHISTTFNSPPIQETTDVMKELSSTSSSQYSSTRVLTSTTIIPEVPHPIIKTTSVLQPTPSFPLVELVTSAQETSVVATQTSWSTANLKTTSLGEIVPSTSSSFVATSAVATTKTLEVLHTSSSTVNQTQKLISQTDNEENEKERRYKSSMHIVMALVIGLLVLCTVLGVIAKRVHDIWMRRHYHRMDFLIDGMYDGYS